MSDSFISEKIIDLGMCMNRIQMSPEISSITYKLSEVKLPIKVLEHLLGPVYLGPILLPVHAIKGPTIDPLQGWDVSVPEQPVVLISINCFILVELDSPICPIPSSPKKTSTWQGTCWSDA